MVEQNRTPNNGDIEGGFGLAVKVIRPRGEALQPFSFGRQDQIGIAPTAFLDDNSLNMVDPGDNTKDEAILRGSAM